ncbi:GTPase Der [Striga asiatica]|uniref:GTPase Der n=1 Tax=Striga asiatica TaxID=4170 RepID=A0A5A7Q023_STRAF|nr:GTPase Der [Striga asiatica]
MSELEAMEDKQGEPREEQEQMACLYTIRTTGGCLPCPTPLLLSSSFLTIFLFPDWRLSWVRTDPLPARIWGKDYFSKGPKEREELQNRGTTPAILYYARLCPSFPTSIFIFPPDLESFLQSLNPNNEDWAILKREDWPDCEKEKSNGHRFGKLVQTQVANIDQKSLTGMDDQPPPILVVHTSGNLLFGLRQERKTSRVVLQTTPRSCGGSDKIGGFRAIRQKNDQGLSHLEISSNELTSLLKDEISPQKLGKSKPNQRAHQHTSNPRPITVTHNPSGRSQTLIFHRPIRVKHHSSHIRGLPAYPLRLTNHRLGAT